MNSSQASARLLPMLMNWANTWYNSRKEYNASQNLKDDSKNNKTEIINNNTNISNRINISTDRNEIDNKRKYYISNINNYNKDKKDMKTEENETKEIKKDREIQIINRRNNIIANPTSIKNEQKNYMSNIIRRSPIKNNEKLENEKPKNTGVYISNINNKSFDSGKNDNKSDIVASRYNSNYNRANQIDTKNNSKVYKSSNISTNTSTNTNIYNKNEIKDDAKPKYN